MANAPLPGGPGNPPCGAAVFEVTRPLTALAVQGANRGATADLCPPDSSCPEPPSAPLGSFSGPVENVLDVRPWTGCVIAESLVITLGRRSLREANGPSKPPDIANFIMPRVRAIIDWGIGGSAVESAEVDWRHGTQLSISAERVNVQARYDVLTPPWLGIVPDPCDLPAYRLSAGVGYGSISTNSNLATLTELVMLQVGGDVQRIAIPPFAVSFTLMLISGAIEVRQTAFGTSFFTIHEPVAPETTGAGYFVENGFPVWNGAEFLDVTSVAEGGQASYALVVFGLALS